MKSQDMDRITLRLDPNLRKRLSELGTLTHAASEAEVLKKAIILYSHMIAQTQEGANIYIIEPNGEKTRLAILL